MTDIYEQLYVITSQRMMDTSMKFNTTKASFIFLINEVTETVDVDALFNIDTRIDNMEYMQRVYFAVLDR